MDFPLITGSDSNSPIARDSFIALRAPRVSAVIRVTCGLLPVPRSYVLTGAGVFSIHHPIGRRLNET